MTEYYTAEEARKVLNRTKTVFYQQINSGDIPFEIDPGRTRGKKFPKRAIDTLASVGKRLSNTKQQLSFSPSTVSDLWHGMQITRTIYGAEDEVPFERLVEWKTINPEVFMSLKEGTKHIGAITFLPIKEDTAIAVINGQLKEKDIPPESIRQWTENNISIYIPTIEILPSGNTHRDRERGTFLLRHTIRWGVFLMIQHKIKNWYAIGATEDGRNILKALGFTEVTNLDDDRKGYILEATKQPVKLVGMYLAKLAE